MSFGLDYVSGPPIADMQKANVAFVCRYLSAVNAQTAIKLLTKAEAQALEQAGIAIVSNYEWYAERPLEGEAAGVADAQIAASQHAACGGPPDRPIYFSVDFDMTASEEAAVAAYFKGVASVIGVQRTGAYGGVNTLKYLFDAGLITWGWQTYAWSGGQWDARAHLQQYQNGVVMSGKSVDYNRATTDDYGQWGGKMASLPANWHDDGKTLTGPNGVPFVLGFRAHVLPRLLAGTWEADDTANRPQYYMSRLEASNPDLGDGDQISTKKHLLGYPHNPVGNVAHLKNTVIEEYVGVELDYTRNQYAALYAAYQKLQAQPTPAPQDPRVSQYAAKLQAVDLLLVQAHQLAVQAVP